MIRHSHIYKKNSKRFSSFCKVEIIFYTFTTCLGINNSKSHMLSTITTIILYINHIFNKKKKKLLKTSKMRKNFFAFIRFI